MGAGAIDAAAARKATRFMRVAQDFELPVIFLADTPGVLPGMASEKAGALRHAADMFAAQHLVLDTLHLIYSENSIYPYAGKEIAAWEAVYYLYR